MKTTTVINNKEAEVVYQYHPAETDNDLPKYPAEIVIESIAINGVDIADIISDEHYDSILYWLEDCHYITTHGLRPDSDNRRVINPNHAEEEKHVGRLVELMDHIHYMIERVDRAEMNLDSWAATFPEISRKAKRLVEIRKAALDRLWLRYRKLYYSR